jgi:hypothetical protein
MKTIPPKKHKKRNLNKVRLSVAIMIILIVGALQLFCIVTTIMEIIKMLFLKEIRIELLILYIFGLILMIAIWCFAIGRIVHQFIYFVFIKFYKKIVLYFDDSKKFTPSIENEISTELNNED